MVKTEEEKITNWKGSSGEWCWWKRLIVRGNGWLCPESLHWYCQMGRGNHSLISVFLLCVFFRFILRITLLLALRGQMLANIFWTEMKNPCFYLKDLTLIVKICHFAQTSPRLKSQFNETHKSSKGLISSEPPDHSNIWIHLRYIWTFGYTWDKSGHSDTFEHLDTLEHWEHFITSD